MFTRINACSIICVFVATFIGQVLCRDPDCGKLPDGLYPNQFTCLKYYHCLQGRTHLKPCAPGTVFDPVSRKCDYLKNVPSCQGFSKSQIGTCRGKTDGLYYNPENCHSYYRCKDGNQWFFTCSTGTIFDPDTQTCNFPQYVRSDCKYMYKMKNI